MKTDNINPLMGDIIKAHSKPAMNGESYISGLRCYVMDMICDFENQLETYKDEGMIESICHAESTIDAYKNVLNHIEEVYYGE